MDSAAAREPKASRHPSTAYRGASEKAHRCHSRERRLDRRPNAARMIFSRIHVPTAVAWLWASALGSYLMRLHY
jgi:hypothetical protein